MSAPSTRSRAEPDERSYLMETLGKDPDFDRDLALETLLTAGSAVAPNIELRRLVDTRSGV